MNKFDRSHLSDEELLGNLKALVSQERAQTARVIADIARIDEDEVDVHVRAARVVWQFPDTVAAIADGRLNPWTVAMLEPYITRENGPELLAAAERKTQSELAQFLGERFPDVPPPVVPVFDLDDEEDFA